MEEMKNEEMSGAVPETTVTEPPKKGKKKFAVIGIIVAVLLVAGVALAANANRLFNTVKEKTSSPEEYYQYVEQKNRDAFLEKFDKQYEKLRDNVILKDQTKKMICQIELGDTLKALASGYGIESAALVSEGKIEGTVTTGKATLQLNEKDALSYNVYMDYSTGEGYLQVPELSSSYLDMTGTLQEASQEASLGDFYSMMTKMDQYIPKTDQIHTLITTYSDIIIKNVKDVQRGEDTLTAGEISGEYTKLDVTCDGNDIKEISKKILETLQDDAVVKELVENVNSDAYTGFQSTIADALTELEEDTSTDTSTLKMSVYVGSDATIVGRVITLTGDKESFEIKEVKPQKGDQFGYDLEITANDVTYLIVSGSGTVKSDKLSGDFSLSLDESLNPGDASVLSMTDLIKVSVNDLDQKALEEDGIVKGNIELSTEQIPALAGYALKIEADGSEDQINDKIHVMVGSDTFATITLATEEGSDPGVTKPEEGAVTYDLSDELALNMYVSEIDLYTFLSDLNTKCGVDLTSLMLGL